jgi:hypothetical protein
MCWDLKRLKIRVTRQGIRTLAYSGDMSAQDHDRPWLLDLATPQRGSAPPVLGAVYDEASQMTHLQEPFVPVIDTSSGPQTKKADREVGEDQKG